ncbi:MAG: hypothetical protein JST55_09490 [Bacteroidetes bacterium]|nr:hypothetical protein [Bacteroidota bacterium]
MRLIYYTSFLLIFSIQFISCNTDSPVDPDTDGSNYYNWTVTPVSMDSVYRISAANDDVAFIGGNSSYKISGSTVTRIDFQDTAFKCGGVEAFDKNSAVFWGGTSATTSEFKFKLYDTGALTTYTFSNAYPYTKLTFISKNKFYYASYDNFYLFDNGTLTGSALPPSESPIGFGKAGGSTYLFTSFNSSSFYQDRAYRIVGNTLLLVSSVAPQGRIHFLNNDIVRVTQDSTNHLLDYFNGSDWINFFSFTTPANTYYIQYLAGDTRNQFLWIWFDYNAKAYASVFSVNAKIEQTNFPTSAITVSIPAVRTVSNYADNTYYIIDKYHPTKFVKGKLK